MNVGPLRGDSWIGGNQIEQIKQFVVVPRGLVFSEEAYAGLGNLDQIDFGLPCKTKAHD